MDSPTIEQRFKMEFMTQMLLGIYCENCTTNGRRYDVDVRWNYQLRNPVRDGTLIECMECLFDTVTVQGRRQYSVSALSPKVAVKKVMNEVFRDLRQAENEALNAGVQ